MRASYPLLFALLVGCGGNAQSTQGTDATGSGGGSTQGSVLQRCEACASDEACCLTTGRCYAPASEPEACEPPPPPSVPEGSGGGAGGGPLEPLDQKRCSSNAHCEDNELCRPDNDNSACIAEGYCVSRDCASQCQGGADCITAVCGCDGVSYESELAACQAGVRVAATAPCGEPVPGPGPVVIGCADDKQCPSGQSCCEISGRCYDTSCKGCCAQPPAGTTAPCERDDQCLPGQYCAGEGCGTAGGCMWIRGGGECSGEIKEVCGCDGNSYTNECWAHAAGTRVAKRSKCK